MAIIAADPEFRHVAEVVSLTPEIAPGNALERFRSDPAALKSSAMAVLDLKVPETITTHEDAATWSDKLSQVRTIIKNIEARRKAIVEPLKKEAKAVDEEKHRWCDPLDAWEAKVQRALNAFLRFDADQKRRAEDARQKALIAAAEKQQQAENSDNPALAEEASTEIMQLEAVGSAEPIRGFKTEAGTTSVRKTWKVEVVDESLVPDAYWTVDLKKLQATVDAGARSIEGCNVWQEESLTVRTR